MFSDERAWRKTAGVRLARGHPGDRQACRPAVDPLAEAFAVVEPRLRWRRKYSDGRTNDLASFGGHANGVIVGPGGNRGTERRVAGTDRDGAERQISRPSTRPGRIGI
ncbi:MAG TPA: dimethylsulfonioproprionate lyase family protein [Roseiarcus sp.]